MKIEELEKKINASRTTYFNVLVDITDADKLLAVAKAAKRVASMPLDGISDAVRNGLYYEAVTSLTMALAEMDTQ
jgi:hypothetical protein